MSGIRNRSLLFLWFSIVQPRNRSLPALLRISENAFLKAFGKHPTEQCRRLPKY